MTYYDNALHMMESIGGGFVKSLAACYYAADSDNKTKLRAAFKEYFDRYEAQYSAWSASKSLKGTACPYCTSEISEVQAIYFDQTCKGCVARMTKEAA